MRTAKEALSIGVGVPSANIFLFLATAVAAVAWIGTSVVNRVSRG